MGRDTPKRQLGGPGHGFAAQQVPGDHGCLGLSGDAELCASCRAGPEFGQFEALGTVSAQMGLLLAGKGDGAGSRHARVGRAGALAESQCGSCSWHGLALVGEDSEEEVVGQCHGGPRAFPCCYTGPQVAFSTSDQAGAAFVSGCLGGSTQGSWQTRLDVRECFGCSCSWAALVWRAAELQPRDLQAGRE